MLKKNYGSNLHISSSKYNISNVLFQEIQKFKGRNLKIQDNGKKFESSTQKNYF